MILRQAAVCHRRSNHKGYSDRSRQFLGLVHHQTGWTNRDDVWQEQHAHARRSRTGGQVPQAHAVSASCSQFLPMLEHLPHLYGIQRAHRHHGWPGSRSRWIRDNYRDAMAHATGILLDPSIARACASWIGPRARVNAHLRRMLGYYVEWHLCEAGHRFYFMNAMAPPRSRTEPHCGRCGRHLAWRSGYRQTHAMQQRLMACQSTALVI